MKSDDYSIVATPLSRVMELARHNPGVPAELPRQPLNIQAQRQKDALNLYYLAVC